MNGVLEMAEFRVYMTKMSACFKARFGEGMDLDDKECEQCYNAHNRLTPHKEGVSMEDFMAADEIMKILA
jgi:DNA polymerase III alpha subunit (gram-positive type)